MSDLRIETDEPDNLVFDNAIDDDYYASFLRFSRLDCGVQVAESDCGGSIYLTFAQAKMVAERILKWCAEQENDRP